MKGNACIGYANAADTARILSPDLTAREIITTPAGTLAAAAARWVTKFAASTFGG